MRRALVLVLLAAVVVASALLYGGKREALLASHGPDGAPSGAPRRVLVLDLDETLVHYDEAGGTLLVRPHAAEFLRGAAACCDELVVFTAAAREYADAVADHLEQLSGVRLARRFYRGSCGCRPADGAVVKDLRLLGEPPSTRVILLDNTPSTYSLQPRCGMSIPSYLGGREDEELPLALGRIREEFSTAKNW